MNTYTTDLLDLRCMDCMDLMREMPDNSVDSIVTDPPYGLKFMGKKWDSAVPGTPVWAECLRVLKPGGHLLAFAGTRTQHRMASAIEDAGFEIRDMIAWVYGSGFPKSLDVGKAIDREAGAKRGVIGKRKTFKGQGNSEYDQLSGSDLTEVFVTAPATEAARQWNGWGTALKPALEPITLARKPFPGTVAANVQEHGTGAINVDGCRVGTNGETPSGSGKHSKGVFCPHSGSPQQEGPNITPPEGRWPANLIHDGSEEVAALFPETKSGDLNQASVKASDRIYGGGFGNGKTCPKEFKRNSGSAARFFYCAKASKADRDEGVAGVAGVAGCTWGEGIGSASGAAVTRRNNHPTVKPTALMRYLCRLVTPPGGLVLDPFMGSGSTGKAAMLECFRFTGAEMSPEYFEIAKTRIAAAVKRVQAETAQQELAL